MKKIFAVPVENGMLCAHFGRCTNFAIIEAEGNMILSEKFLEPPAHEPGSYPRFLAGLGVSTIIAGGMGMNARQLFSQNNIEVYMGVNSDTPRDLVNSYLQNTLVTGANQCDGGHHHHEEGGHNCRH